MPGALYAIWLREVKRALRDRGQLIGGISRPLLWVLILGIGLNPYFRGEVYGEVRFVVPYTYLQFIFPAVIALNGRRSDEGFRDSEPLGCSMALRRVERVLKHLTPHPALSPEGRGFRPHLQWQGQQQSPPFSLPREGLRAGRRQNHASGVI